MAKKRRQKLGGDSFRKQGSLYLYTKGKQYSLDGKEYIGEYHINNGIAYTGPVIKPGALVLQRYYVDPSHYVYEKLFDFDVQVMRYVNPKTIVWRPKESDYVRGFATRYFVEKRNDDYSYAIEVSPEQYEKIDLLGGIDGSLYHYTSIQWRLVGKADQIALENEKTLREASKIVPSIEYGVKNYLESARLL